jgi:hypothetical protein
MAKPLAFGFTGTQRGMTGVQQANLRAHLEAAAPDWWAHGDCIGADAESHAIARALGLRVAVFPPTNPRKRAFCEGDWTHSTLPYLLRNHLIVNRVQRMYAAPGEMEEVLRSGTWATIRYARRVERSLTILWPDGTVSYTPTTLCPKNAAGFGRVRDRPPGT